MGLSRTVFQINGAFGRKSHNFLTSVYFASQLKGFPLELDIRRSVKKARMMGLPGREIRLMISSAVWIQYTNVTDGQTPGDNKDRAYALTYSSFAR